jgi:hypothetical protein
MTRPIALLLTLIACSVLAAPLSAQDASSDGEPPQDVVFPEGSSFGVVPFEGSTPAVDFTGFADLETSATVMINELPLEAWEEITKNFSDPAALASAGINVTSNEKLMIGGMEALRISGTQSVRGVTLPKCLVLVKGRESMGLITAQMPFAQTPDADACALIKGVTQRASATLAEQMAALPFALNDLGGMRVTNVIGGSAVTLTIGPLDQDRSLSQPVVIVANAIDNRAAGVDLQEYSKAALLSSVMLKFGQQEEAIETSLAGLPATRLVYAAKNDETGAAMRLVQWMGFKPDGGYVRIIGFARAPAWAEAYPAFERIAEGLQVSADDASTAAFAAPPAQDTLEE